MSTMRAWQVREWCSPEQLSLVELPIPQPGPGQLLVRVVAAALNFLDTLMIRGQYQLKPPLPFTPGVELAGEVVRVGPGCRFQPGDRVCGLVDHGAFADHALVDDSAMLRAPRGIDLVDAAAIPVVYPTAYCALKLQGRMQPGEYVLVHAGAGGVGLATIQLAKFWGGKVIATAGDAEKTAICLREGADLAIDYNRQDWLDGVKKFTADHRADLIVDMVGGDITEQSLRCLAWSGRLLIVGFAGGRIAEIPANRLLLNNAAAIGVLWGGYRRRQPDLYAETCAAVFDLIDRDAVRPVISGYYPFDQAPLALLDLAGRKTHGKVLLLP